MTKILSHEATVVLSIAVGLTMLFYLFGMPPFDGPFI
jgi:hypothetical protein